VESPKAFLTALRKAKSLWITELEKMGYTKLPIYPESNESAEVELVKAVAEIDGRTIFIRVQNRSEREHPFISGVIPLTVYAENETVNGQVGVMNCFHVPSNRLDLMPKLEKQFQGDFTSYADLYSWIWHLPRHLTSLDHTRFEALALADRLLADSKSNRSRLGRSDP
jgi:predicted CoA-binding protein